MAKFTYVSQNAEGKKVTAVADAASRQELLLRLKESGLTVFEIREVGGKDGQVSSAGKWLARFGITQGSIPTEDMAVFWRQFSTMVSAGLPVIEALEAIVEELDHPYFKTTLEKVVADMWDGKSLSQSLSRHDKVFSRMIASLVAAAEESGSLPAIAQEIAAFLENRDRLIRKVRAALAYPAFLISFFFLVIAVSTFWIIPMFRDIYSSFKAKLPPLTEIVFGLNSFILHHLLWIAIAMIVGLFFFIRWARSGTGREVLDRFVIQMPVLGKVIQRASVARFARSLAVLVKGGVPITRALEMVTDATGSRMLAAAIRRAREEILKGSKIAASLKKQLIFPRLAVRMVSVGEETGNLSSILEKTAEFYESRVDAAIMTINALVEPIIIVGIGAFVLVFVLALYMPIFSLAMNAKG